MKPGKAMARRLAEVAREGLAFDVELLDVSRCCEYAGWFLVVSAKNRIHIDALRDRFIEFAKEKKTRLFGVDGRAESGWIILDFGDVIAHIFLPQVREYYDLPAILGGAKTVDLNSPASRKTRTRN